MKVPILVLLFAGIPENIALATLAFVLAKVELEWKKIFSIGVILALNAYLLRLLPITFGVHTIVNIGLLIVLLSVFTQADLVASVISSFLSILALIVVETLNYIIILPLFNIPIKTVINSPILRILIGLPLVIILFLISYIVKIYQKREK